MCSDVVIRIEGISKHFQVFSSPMRRLLNLVFGLSFSKPKNITALQNVSLQVMRGETVAVIGRNGSGKSTLLQVLCNILTPSEGSVEVHGRIAALLELGAGFSTEFTGRENIYMSAAVYGLSRDMVEQRMQSILDFAEIGEFIDQPVKTYSSGMFVRLAFAVIAHVDADILVIDEALAVGDAYFTQKCMRFLREFKTKGTLVFVSHDTHSVVTLCDRALWLDRGVVRELGSAKAVSESYVASLYEDRSVEYQGVTEQVEGQFGDGAAEIVSCQLLSEKGHNLSLLMQAQKVTLQIICCATREITQPILGFFIRDRLGQPLFGENSIEHVKDWPSLLPGQRHTVEFSFHMPLLATGDYTLGVALGSGTQLKHVQHHWIFDACTFKSQASPHLTGFVQLEALRCQVKNVED